MNAPCIQSLFHHTPRHRTHYLAAGPVDGPLLIFVHGWPELSRSWRHQLPAFAALGFRVVAPDLRGADGTHHRQRPLDGAGAPGRGERRARALAGDRPAGVLAGAVGNAATHSLISVHSSSQGRKISCA